MNNFERGPSKDHSCEVWSKSDQWFRRRCHLKKLFMAGRTDARQTKCDHESQRCHYVTGELKMLSAEIHLHSMLSVYKASDIKKKM